MKNKKMMLAITGVAVSSIMLVACGTQSEEAKEVKTLTASESKSNETVNKEEKPAPTETKTEEHIDKTNVESIDEMDKTADAKPKASEDKQIKTTPAVTAEQKVSQSEKEKKAVPSLPIETFKKINPEFHSGWVPSPDGLYQVTVEGRGEQSAEEGLGTIAIKKKADKQAYKINLNDVLRGEQVTPKAVEWKDNQTLYVIAGFPYGTVSKGGNLFELDIKTNTVTPIFDNLKDGEEIVSIKKEGNHFTYEKHIYDDEDMIEGHTEIKTLKK